LKNLSKKILLFLFLLVFNSSFAQYPQHFTYDDENGLPNNEVYSIVQDNKGFIWIGCDGGLYKYDGIRYTSYKSDSQKSRSMNGLTLSSQGKLYCTNFQSQVFVVENDSLIELKTNSIQTITSIAAGSDQKIYVNHIFGISIYNERTKKWENNHFLKAKQTNHQDQFVTKSGKKNPKGAVLFIHQSGIGTITSTQYNFFKCDVFKENTPGLFLMDYHKENLWIFSMENQLIYKYSKNSIKKVTNKNLLSVLAKRKITSVRSLADGKLWICTYNGIIKYDTEKDIATLYYPELSFSDCLLDREGSYWLSTLQAGILRIPNLDLIVWNKEHEQLKNEKISSICFGVKHIFFATLDGSVGQLDIKTGEILIYNSDTKADVQSFDFDAITQTLWFNINNVLYAIKDGKLNARKTSEITAIKARKQIGEFLFIGSSKGSYVNGELIEPSWSRNVLHDYFHNLVYFVTNNGLLQLHFSGGKWKVKKHLLKGIQLLSAEINSENQQLYVLTFDGKINKVSKNGVVEKVCEVSDKIQSYQIKIHHSKIYVATNKGLQIYDLKSNKWQILTKLSGLASNNIQGLVILDNIIWLATGKGIQKIPINKKDKIKRSLIYLKKCLVGERKINPFNTINLKSGESLQLYPEAIAYKSNGDFQYAYRLKNSDSIWIKLPASVEVIDIQNIPIGNFQIELKLIDHQGFDSENTLQLKGYVSPPFWRSWWFISILILVVSLLVYLYFKSRIRKIKRNQQKEIERINLENELILSRESALKTQMNPHFIFNVLNSIKAYIYKNEKQNASSYLSDFSDLIRMFLNMSNQPLIPLAEELNMLNLYINLEAMLLNKDFEFKLDIEKGINQQQIKIPSLIIQPFVENAFKHGLHHKSGEKKLTISIQQIDASTLKIEIEDNGIGREATREIQEKSLKTHTSFATSAIEKRIELLSRGNNKVKVETIDLKAENKAIGTKVIVTIAIQNDKENPNPTS
jgi:ligand-binding sensor domain-containing protein